MTRLGVDDEKAVKVFIDSRHIDELETALAFLKKCHKFWTCVAERDAGKRKHCYMPKGLPQ
jgi:hypothetical protein